MKKLSVDYCSLTELLAMDSEPSFWDPAWLALTGIKRKVAPCPFCGDPITVPERVDTAECESCGYATSLTGYAERWRRSPLAKRGLFLGKWRTWIPVNGSLLIMLRRDGRRATVGDVLGKAELIYRRNESVGGRTVSADYASFRNAMLASKADVIRRALKQSRQRVNES